MKPAFAYLFVALVLLQTFSRELLAVNFAVNRTAIAMRYCVNRARPEMQCNGRCYFAKTLKQQEERENKSAGALKERLEMLPSVFNALVPVAPSGWGQLAMAHAMPRLTRVPACPVRGIFHPPQA